MPTPRGGMSPTWNRTSTRTRGNIKQGQGEAASHRLVSPVIECAEEPEAGCRKAAEETRAESEGLQ